MFHFIGGGGKGRKHRQYFLLVRDGGEGPTEDEMAGWHH